jgi:class 3 adenylate cyclase
MIRGEADPMVRRFRDQFDNLLAHRLLNDGIDYHPELHYPNVSESRHRLLTVMFTDIVNSSEKARDLGDDKWSVILESHDRLVGAQVRRRGGRVVKGTGDGVFATFDSPSMAVEAAARVVKKVKPLGLEARVGLHAGEVEVSRGDVFGGVVNTASRIAGRARPSEVLVSETVRDLVAGSGHRFSYRKRQKLKGVGKWRLCALIID